MINDFISVLMTVYNGERYLDDSIKSILNQSYTNFEFIIVNDGSSDRTIEILNSYEDPRIRVINNSINLGLIKSLNLGLKFCNGDYIFRMDADDISFPTRLEEQLKYMVETGTDICGTWFTILNYDSPAQIIKHKIGHYQIKYDLIYNSSLGHPTVAFHKNVLKGYNDGCEFYSSNFKHGEDYELWTRLIFNWKFNNLSKSQLYYRIHGVQISNLNSDEQNEITRVIKSNYLKNLFPKFKNFEKLELFFSNGYVNKYGYISLIRSYFLLIFINFIDNQFPRYFFFWKLNKLTYRNLYARKS